MNLRKISTFVIAFVPLFAGFFLLYQVLLTSYLAVVLLIANFFGHQVPPEMWIELLSGGSLKISFTQAGSRLDFTVPIQVVHILTYGLVFLPALLLATPSALKKRIRRFAIGMLALLGIHVISVIGFFHAEICLQFYDPFSFGCYALEWIFSTGGQIFTILIWSLLTWREWFPAKN